MHVAVSDSTGCFGNNLAIADVNFLKPSVAVSQVGDICRSPKSPLSATHEYTGPQCDTKKQNASKNFHQGVKNCHNEQKCAEPQHENKGKHQTHKDKHTEENSQFAAKSSRSRLEAAINERDNRVDIGHTKLEGLTYEETDINQIEQTISALKKENSSKDETIMLMYQSLNQMKVRVIGLLEGNTCNIESYLEQFCALKPRRGDDIRKYQMALEFYEDSMNEVNSNAAKLLVQVQDLFDHGADIEEISGIDNTFESVEVDACHIVSDTSPEVEPEQQVVSTSSSIVESESDIVDNTRSSSSGNIVNDTCVNGNDGIGDETSSNSQSYLTKASCSNPDSGYSSTHGSNVPSLETNHSFQPTFPTTLNFAPIQNDTISWNMVNTFYQKKDNEQALLAVPGVSMMERNEREARKNFAPFDASRNFVATYCLPRTNITTNNPPNFRPISPRLTNTSLNNQITESQINYKHRSGLGEIHEKNNSQDCFGNNNGDDDYDDGNNESDNKIDDDGEGEDGSEGESDDDDEDVDESPVKPIRKHRGDWGDWKNRVTYISHVGPIGGVKWSNYGLPPLDHVLNGDKNKHSQLVAGVDNTLSSHYNSCNDRSTTKNNGSNQYSSKREVSFQLGLPNDDKALRIYSNLESSNFGLHNDSLFLYPNRDPVQKKDRSGTDTSEASGFELDTSNNSSPVHYERGNDAAMGKLNTDIEDTVSVATPKNISHLTNSGHKDNATSNNVQCYPSALSPEEVATYFKRSEYRDIEALLQQADQEQAEYDNNARLYTDNESDWEDDNSNGGDCDDTEDKAVDGDESDWEEDDGNVQSNGGDGEEDYENVEDEFEGDWEDTYDTYNSQWSYSDNHSNMTFIHRDD